jgi:hypothetical protein
MGGREQLLATRRHGRRSSLRGVAGKHFGRRGSLRSRHHGGTSQCDCGSGYAGQVNGFHRNSLSAMFRRRP